jgi:hypothetical protein
MKYIILILLWLFIIEIAKEIWEIKENRKLEHEYYLEMLRDRKKEKKEDE